MGNDPMMGIPLEKRAMAMIAGEETLTVANLIDNLGISGLLRVIVRVAKAKVEHCAESEKDILTAIRTDLRKVAASSAPESTLRRIQAIMHCRELLTLNVAPLLAVEEMALSLAEG